MRERERGRLGGGEEWGISKQEVTELRGTGGQFSSTQRGQSRGHWPFPPFLSLCPPPHHSIMLTLFVFHFAADLKLPLSSSGHISSRAPPCFFPTCVPSFLHSDLLVYFSPTLSSSSFPFFFFGSHPHDLPIFPYWVVFLFLSSTFFAPSSLREPTGLSCEVLLRCWQNTKPFTSILHLGSLATALSSAWACEKDSGRQTNKERSKTKGKKMQNAIHPPKLEPGGQLNVLELFVTVWKWKELHYTQTVTLVHCDTFLVLVFHLLQKKCLLSLQRSWGIESFLYKPVPSSYKEEEWPRWKMQLVDKVQSSHSTILSSWKRKT